MTLSFKRYQGLLTAYLRPQWLRVLLLFTRLVLLRFILALHPLGPGNVSTQRLIKAGVIATTEALCDFAWQMQGKHTAMHPA